MIKNEYFKNTNWKGIYSHMGPNETSVHVYILKRANVDGQGDGDDIHSSLDKLAYFYQR